MPVKTLSSEARNPIRSSTEGSTHSLEVLSENIHDFVVLK